MKSIVEDFQTSLEKKLESFEAYWEMSDGDFEEDSLSGFPLPYIEEPNDDWRVSVSFDDWDVDYWFNRSTALFFGTLKFRQDLDVLVRIFPSMGETAQWESGLIGAGSITVRLDTSHRVDIASGLTELPEFLIISFGGVEPFWIEYPAIQQNFWQIKGNEDKFGMSWDVAIKNKFPKPLRNLWTVFSAEAISYALGYCVLVHGMKATFANIDKFNEILQAISK